MRKISGTHNGAVREPRGPASFLHGRTHTPVGGEAGSYARDGSVSIGGRSIMLGPANRISGTGGPCARGEIKQMHFDLAAIAETNAYKLLISTVVPRPIALVTTLDASGRVNAAPFSFFNAVSSRPPVVVLGINGEGPGGSPHKDTEQNIRDSGEFVVNLVDEVIAKRMNICAVDFPTGTGELNIADLKPLDSVAVKAPRIAEAPVAFECKSITRLTLGGQSSLEVGRWIHIHTHTRAALVERANV